MNHGTAEGNACKVEVRPFRFNSAVPNDKANFNLDAMELERERRMFPRIGMANH
jgi:hypothetical protein